MKKSTVLIVLITFVLSVVIVGIFGMRMMSYNTRIYVKELTPTRVFTSTGQNAELKKRENAENTYYFVVDYAEGLDIRIDYSINPADVTDKTVSAEITSAQTEGNPVAEFEESTLHVYRTGSVRLLYRAMDGSGQEFTVICYVVDRE